MTYVWSRPRNEHLLLGGGGGRIAAERFVAFQAVVRDARQ